MFRDILRSMENEKTAWYWLGAIAALTAVLRWHGFGAPLHTDICVYAMVGDALRHGGQLYVNLLDNKPPGIYLLYLAAIWIGGDSPIVFNLLGLFFILFSQILIFLVARRIGGNTIGLLAAFIWSVATLDTAIWANQPHTEVFINTFLLLAVWGGVRWQMGSSRSLWWSGIGLGTASMFKTNVLFVYLTLFAFWAFQSWRTGRLRTHAWKLDGLALIIPPGVVWTALTAYFYFHGTLPEFFDIVFKALSAYAGHIIKNEFQFFFVWKTHAPIFKHLFLVMCMVSMGWLIWKLIRRRLAWTEAWVAAYLFGCMLMIGSLNGLYILYYQVFLPPLTLMTALGLRELRKINRYSFMAAVAGLAVLLGYYGISYLRQSPDAISASQYGEVLVADRELGKYLESITGPEDRIYQWGMNAHLNYYSRRKPPVGLIQNHLLDFSPDPVRFKIKSKVFDALMKSPPEVILFAAWIGDFRSNMFYQSLWPYYDYFGCYDKYLVFVRKDYAIDPKADSGLYHAITEQSFNSLGTARLILAKQSRALYREGRLITGRESRDLLEPEGDSRFARTVRQGNRYARANQWREAMESWAKANDLRRNQGMTYANLGIYHERMGSFYLALHHYESAYKKLGKPWDDYYRSARMRMIHELHALEASDPGVPKVKRDLMQPVGQSEYDRWIFLGNEEAGRVRWEKAKVLWEKAVQADGSRPEAFVNLAIYYEIHYRFSEAMRTYRAIPGQARQPWKTYMEELEQLMRTLPAEADSPSETLY